jgi:hypothetical protein
LNIRGTVIQFTLNTTERTQMPDIDPEINRPERFTPFIALGVVLLVVATILGGLLYAGTKVESTADLCTIKGLNEVGTRGGIARTIYAEGCNGETNPRIQMFYLGVPGTPLEVSDVYDNLEIGKTYDFKTKEPRIPIFADVPTVVEIKEASPAK